MEIGKVLDDGASKVKFAYFDNEVKTFVISNREEFVGSPRFPQDISLKDVEYKIYEGVLYVHGTRIHHFHFNHIFDLATVWSEKFVYMIISEEKNSQLEHPFEVTDVYIKRWWWKPKKIRGIDLTDVNEDYHKWYKRKKEEPFEFAISNFKLIENDKI